LRPEYKRGAVINDLVAVLWLVLLVGCGTRESLAPANPAALLEVVATVPTEGASDVPIQALISVTFSTELDTTSIRSGVLGIGCLAGEICCLGRTITLRPVAPLEYARTYTVEIDSSVTDCNGHRLGGSYVWQFRTIDDPHLPDFPDPPGKLPSISDAGP